MEVEIKAHERLDDLHRCGYMIIQDPQRFCFGIDAVLLSGFAKAYKGERVLDLGTGTGVIPLLMAAKTEAAQLTGLEIQADSVDMAQRSVAYNKLDGRVEIMAGDIKEIKSLFKAQSFQVVTVNPPYVKHGGGIVGGYSPKAIARHEVLLKLEDVIKAAAYCLQYKGRFYMVHRPYRLVDILYLMRTYKLEPKVIRFVQPYEGKEPNMVLIEGAKEGGPMVKITAPLIIYEREGIYTQEAYNIYYG